MSLRRAVNDRPPARKLSVLDVVPFVQFVNVNIHGVPISRVCGCSSKTIHIALL